MLPIAQVQKELYTALFAALAPVPVLDDAGPNQAYPFVTIGESLGVSTDLLREQSIDLEFTVHCWSRQPGMQEISGLMESAKDALDRRRAAVGAFQIESIWNYSQTLRDADGKTRHGILRFRVMTFQPLA